MKVIEVFGIVTAMSFSSIAGILLTVLVVRALTLGRIKMELKTLRIYRLLRPPAIALCMFVVPVVGVAVGYVLHYVSDGGRTGAEVWMRTESANFALLFVTVVIWVCLVPSLLIHYHPKIRTQITEGDTTL